MKLEYFNDFPPKQLNIKIYVGVPVKAFLTFPL